jgi:hypothetical protein
MLFLATQKRRKRRRFKGGQNSEISSLPDEHIQLCSLRREYPRNNNKEK